MEGQDVCLQMSRDSERREWDERGKEGEKRWKEQDYQ